MKIHYTGRNSEINEQQKTKVQAKFEKIQKILTRRDNLEAHVTLSRQRHRCEAEVTLHALHHTLVVTGSAADAYNALTQAVEKLSQQAVKNKHKLIDGRRPERQRGEPSPAIEAAIEKENADLDKVEEEATGPLVVRNNRVEPKPMTEEEALLLLQDSNREQVTYRDAASGSFCVLLRRRDGGYELVAP